jgi:hypothetical protein
MAAARREDPQNSLEPTHKPPCELSRDWKQADHNLLHVMHYTVPTTWKAAVEQLAKIDVQTGVLRQLSTQELSKELYALNKAYGFQQMPYHPDEIVRDENIVLENMLLYVEMQASGTAKEQRVLIDSALYSPTVRSDDESHHLRQRNLPCEFPHRLSPL